MALTLGTNSYVTLSEAELYLEDRIDIAEWEAANDDIKEKALVTATRFIDTLAFAGYASEETQALSWPRTGQYRDSARGRTISFDSSYLWSEVEDSSFSSDWKALPIEIRRIKEATIEQAYHFVSNDGVLDTKASEQEISSVSIGSLSVSGVQIGATPQSSPKRSDIAISLLSDLTVGSGKRNWFRSN